MMQQRIQGKTTITKPGTYTLAADVQRGAGTRISGACIDIRSSDVVLDGAGRTIDGWGISDTTGIQVRGSGTLRNVTVKNVKLTDWNRGVHFHDVANATVRNVEATANSYGISFERARGSTVERTTSTGNFVGVGFDLESEDNEVNGGRIAENHATDVLDQSDCLK